MYTYIYCVVMNNIEAYNICLLKQEMSKSHFRLQKEIQQHKV